MLICVSKCKCLIPWSSRIQPWLFWNLLTDYSKTDVWTGRRWQRTVGCFHRFHSPTTWPTFHRFTSEDDSLSEFVLLFCSFHILYTKIKARIMCIYIYVYGIIWIDTVHQTFAYMWVSDTPTYHIELIISIKCNWFPWMFHEYSMNIALVSHWYAIIPEIPLLCH